MATSLSQLPLTAVTHLGSRLRALGDQQPTSTESLAREVVRTLREELVEPDGLASAVLARMYVMTRKSRLEHELQQLADQSVGRELAGETRCMALVATRGDRPEWNDRRRSRGHRVIPLPTEEVLGALPMVVQLVVQLGIPVSAVVRPDPELILELSQRTYNVFHVPDALGSPFIPAQAEFVVPHGVRSVVGFGGLLPSGDVFATLLFTRVSVPRSVADMFRNIALNTKVALLACASIPMFEQVPLD